MGFGSWHNTKEKIYWLMYGFSSLFKTCGFTLLGWPYGDEEMLLPILIFIY
jgi:hypothetical protein